MGPTATDAIRILLVDDHRLFREGIRALLQREPGLELVGEAESGRAALQEARSSEPNVVLMDVAMSGMNGVEATRQFQSELPHIRVLGLSMHSERRFVTGMLRAGACGYVLKEVAFEELVLAVRRVHAGHRYMSPRVTEEVVGEYLERFASEPSDAAALTPREREVLQLLAEGHTTRLIAGALHVSVKTVESHRARIMSKLEVHSIAELTKYAIREGITAVDS